MSTVTDPLSQLDRLAEAATAAFQTMRRSSRDERASWLRAAADGLDEDADALVSIADDETRLGVTRLRGEVARTSAQLRLFADVVIDGLYLEPVIDHADPTTTPPQPDLRRMLQPIGPVAVFAASNFPFAFSVAGGDTASALAVGCPVIVKAHSGHLALARRTAETVVRALAEAGAPSGSLALVEGHETGIALVEHPRIRAVGFTGSLRGGRALFDRAAARPDPIPFFGELGSLNPVVVSPGADRVRGSELAAGLAASFQLGAGQFCTKPGLVFVPRGSRLEADIAEHVDPTERSLLTTSISSGFLAGIDAILDVPGVDLIAGKPDREEVRPVVAAVDLATLEAHRATLVTEVFGPATLLVRYDDMRTLHEHLESLEGSLTATIHSEPDEDIGDLLTVAEQLAGRVLFDGWPTGVAVTWSQHHGGPWPATTSQFTSVGATAVRRFLRPVVYQDARPEHLPHELRDENPLGISRRVDGVLVV